MDVKCNLSEKIGEECSRLFEFKKRSIICDQERRRHYLLEEQKRRRNNVLCELRNIPEYFKDLDSEMDDNRIEESMEWTETEPKVVNLKEIFMLSEWLSAIPENFEEKWMFVVCPVGKRCLVRSAKGFTSVYGKRGNRVAKFQSALPNGSYRNFSEFSKHSNSEVTILDCIWSPQVKAYYILDLICWKGQMYMNTEMSFRAFWIKSKIEETPSLLERSHKNLFPFIPLNYNTCDSFTISSVMSKYQDEPKVDGILFYHSETHYTPGHTPLVLWLKPFMLPEVLNIAVPEQYIQMKPSFYVNMSHYIAWYEEKQNQKKKFKKKRRNLTKEEEEIEKLS